MGEEHKSSQPQRSHTMLHITTRTGQQATFHGDLQALLLFYARHPDLAPQLEGMHIAIERKQERKQEHK
jgi:mannose/fructose/N-acetylgalactosamine-specific phosphotransferase system component IID